MVNELSWNIDWIDSQDWVRADVSKVTEQDVKRAQWGSQQAKQAQDEIKKQKTENNNVAHFLSFLLKELKNEEMISAIYTTFFKVIDQKTKISYLRKSINNLVIIGFFAPFFPNELKKFKLTSYFQNIDNLNKAHENLDQYIVYIKNLSKKYHDNVPINQSSLLDLLVLIIGEFWLSKHRLNSDWREKIKKELLTRLK